MRCLGLRGVVSGSVKPPEQMKSFYGLNWHHNTRPKKTVLKKKEKKLKQMFVYLVFYMYTAGVSVALISFFQNNVVLFSFLLLVFWKIQLCKNTEIYKFNINELSLHLGS